MKFYISIWICLGAICVSFAQAVTLSDRLNNQPLEGAILTSENPQAFTSTNALGQASLEGFVGSAQIVITYLGYKTQVVSYAQLQWLDFKVQLEPLPLRLEEIVVSGTRWQQSSGNVPSKIITLSPREVALQNPQTAADLLGITGRIFIQKSQQGGGSPMIRGFATNRLIYTVDGVRMNTAIFRSGNLQNVINLDPFATEKTEVLFGPGSVIYGSDAIGGVMSFQTLTPQMSLTEKPLITGKGGVRYASTNNEKTGHFDVNLGWRKWAFITSFSYWDFDHLRQGSHGPGDYIKKIYPQRQDGVDVVITQSDSLLQIPSAYSQINIMQKIRFTPNEKWDVQYGFHHSETSPYGRYDRHNRFRNGTLRYAEWDYGPQLWLMNHLALSHKANHTLFDQMTIRMAQQTFVESRIERAFGKSDRNTQTEHVRAYSVNADFTKQILLKNILYYGLEYVFNNVTSEGELTDIKSGTFQTGPSRYPQSQWHSMAAYVNDKLQISDKITLQAGLRYNRFILNADFSNNLDFYPFPFSEATIQNHALTGSLGSIYRPVNNWVIKANFGTAFRSPNVDDIGKVFDSEPGAVTVPDPNLKAEYAWNIDLGVARIIRDVVKLDITGYYTLLQNALVRRNFQLNGQDSILYNGEMSRVQAIQNAAFARVYGVQAGVEVTLPVGFSFISDVNIQVGEEELDDGSLSPSRHAAPWFGSSRLRYRNKELTIECNTVYQGSRSYDELPAEEQAKDEIYAKDENGKNYSPSWYTLNIKCMYQFNKTFTVSGGLENLTDQRYRPYSSGLSGPGRNFILSLNARF